MRGVYISLSVLSGVLAALIVGLFIVQLVNGHTNILFPGLGMVVSLTAINRILILLESLVLGLALAARSRSQNRR